MAAVALISVGVCVVGFVVDMVVVVVVGVDDGGGRGCRGGGEGVCWVLMIVEVGVAVVVVKGWDFVMGHLWVCMWRCGSPCWWWGIGLIVCYCVVDPVHRWWWGWVKDGGG